MSFTHTIRTLFSAAGGASLSGSVATVADAEDNRDIVVAGSTNDFAVALTLAVANLKSFYALSDKDVLIETNSSTVPPNTLSLKAGIPYSWTAAGALTNPFTTNITSLFISNANPAAATVQLRIAQDATP